MKIVRVKGNIGILNIESKLVYGIRRMNNVSLEDGTLLAVRDDELEVLQEVSDDWAEESIKED